MAACYAANIRLNLNAFSSQRVESENADMKYENEGIYILHGIWIIFAPAERSPRNLLMEQRY